MSNGLDLIFKEILQEIFYEKWLRFVWEIG